MNIIYEAAVELANEQRSIITRFDIEFDFEVQSYKGYLKLANGNEYTIGLSKYWSKITA